MRTPPIIYLANCLHQFLSRPAEWRWNNKNPNTIPKQRKVAPGNTRSWKGLKSYRSLLRSQSETNCDTMNIQRTVLFLSVIVTLCCVNPSNAQFGNFFRDLFRPITNLFRPVTSGFRGLFGGNTINALRSEGRDPLFPADCGRDDDGKGKLCFGDPDLCRASK